MIKSGYKPITEAVSGELAAALKGTPQKDKNSLIWRLNRADIDFNRSISEAERIKANDPRLKVEGNIIIGVYEDVYGKKCITAYQVGSGPIIDTKSDSEVHDQSGKVVKIRSFANVSWKTWVSIMSSFYIIEKDKAVPVSSLRNQRYDNKVASSDGISESLSNKVKEICERYGYLIKIYSDTPYRDVIIRNKKQNSKVGINWEGKEGFVVTIRGTNLAEPEAREMIEDMTKAIELVHKLNQVNIDKVKIM